MEEGKANIYNKKHGEKKSQNKRNVKPRMNCKVKVQNSGEIKKNKSGENVRRIVIVS